MRHPIAWCDACAVPRFLRTDPTERHPLPLWWERTLHFFFGYASDHTQLPDLRELPSRRIAVTRTPYVVNDLERRGQDDRLYVLRDERRAGSRRSDVAVYSNGRGVGFLPETLGARVLGPLKAIGGAAIVNGAGPTASSIRLRVDVPTREAFERFAAAHQVPAPSEASAA